MKTLAVAEQALGVELVRHIREQRPEADDGLNYSSIEVIRAMKRECGAAYLLDLNRGTYELWNGITKLTNFCADYVLPVWNEELAFLVQLRLVAEYEGAQTDLARLRPIQQRIGELHGSPLMWS